MVSYFIQLNTDAPQVRAVGGKHLDMRGVREGQTLRLRCIVDARPPPTYVTWTKDVSVSMRRSAAVLSST